MAVSVCDSQPAFKATTSATAVQQDGGKANNSKRSGENRRTNGERPNGLHNRIVLLTAWLNT